MDLSFLSIDFNKLFDSILNALISMVRLPFQMINNLPEGVKTAGTITLIIITIIIGALVWKLRNEWRKVQR